MELIKYYALYSDKKQTKLLSGATTLEELKSETEYYASGVWFEYDQKVGNNLIFNEKIMTGIVFPKEPKKRHYEMDGLIDTKGSNFKWVS